MFRVIYMIEVFDTNANADDVLIARRYAANMKTADKIAKQYKGNEVVIRKTSKNGEWAWINQADVERL